MLPFPYTWRSVVPSAFIAFSLVSSRALPIVFEINVHSAVGGSAGRREEKFI